MDLGLIHAVATGKMTQEEAEKVQKELDAAATAKKQPEAKKATAKADK